MGKDITDEEKSMLSDEERAALEAEDDRTPEEIAAAEEAAAKAREEGKTEEQKAAEAEETAKKTQEEADAKAAAEAEEKKETPAGATPAPAAEPAFVLQSEQKHGTIEEIEAKMAALDAKFEDGEVTLTEYNKERAGYVEAITEIKMFGTINAQVQKSAAEKGWKESQSEFFKGYPEYRDERIKNVAFVDAVNRLLASEESKTMTDAKVLEKAREECDAAFYPNGRGTVKKEEDPAPDAEAEKRKALEAAKKAEIDKAAGAKSLSNVPAAEGNLGDDKFDAIDKLTGEAYENAVAHLSAADRAIYAARG